MACAGALVAGTTARLAAQDRPVSLRLAVESAFERVAESDALASVGVSRIHADLSREHTSRRSKIAVWSGITAEEPWMEGNRGSLAGALNVGGDVTLSRRNTLTFGQQFSSAPTDVFAFLGSGAPAVLSRAVISGSELPETTRTTSESGQVALTRVIDSGSLFTLAGLQSVFVTDANRVVSAGVSANLSRRFRANTGWHVGYQFVDSTSRVGESVSDDRRHDLDVGIDYARPLTFWRHTRMSLTTGSTLLTTVDGSHFRLNVAAQLSHQLSKQWSATADYSRPTSYVPGFTQPLVSDALRVGFTGMLPHRIALNAAVGTAWGTEESTAGASFVSYTGALRVTRRLSSFWSVEAEYHDGWYRFGGALQAAAIPPAYGRRGFRAGLVWAPRSSPESNR